MKRINRFSSFFILSFFMGSVVGTLTAALPFTLGDSDPASPYFKKRFMASYGINESIEPMLDPRDRPLYDKILPYLEKRPEEAYRILEQEVDRESNAAFDFLLGSLAYQMDRLPDAKRWMEVALKKFPSFRRAYRTLALIDVRNGQYEEAIEPLKKVISLGGGDAQSYGLLAYAQLAGESYRSALSAYEMARMFDSHSLDFKRGEAHCLLMLKRYREAIGLFDELIREHSGETDFWIAQANAWIALEEYSEAIPNLEMVDSLGKATEDTLYLLGDLYMREETPQLALKAYSKALANSKILRMDKAIRALTYFTERAYIKEARTLLNQIKTHVSDKGVLAGSRSSLTEKERSALVLAEAALLQQEGEHHQVVERLLPILEKDPLNGDGLLLLAKSYQALGAREQAVFYLERATSVPEKQVEALLALARLSIQNGELQEALPYLRKAQALHFQPHVAQYIEQLERRR